MSTVELNPQVRELADKLKANHAMGEDKRIEYKDADKLFAENLMSLDDLVKAQSSLLTMGAALTLATGELGQADMIKNKDVNRVSSRAQIGHSRIETTYDRQVSGTAAGKPWVKNGRASTDIVIGTGTSTRAYRDVVSHLASEADKVFSN